MRVEDAPYIPIHPLCRCVYIPISKFWEELEIDPQTERASMFGPTTGKYPDWLAKQETKKPGFGKNILGKNYQDWLDKKYSLGEKAKQFTPQSTVADYIEREKLKTREPRESRKKLELKKKEDMEKKEALRKKLAKEALKKKIEQWNTFQDLQALGVLAASDEMLDDDDEIEVEVDNIVGSENNSWGDWNEKNISKNEREKLTKIENYYKKHKKLPEKLEDKIELAKLKNKYWVKKGDHKIVIAKKYKIKKIKAKVTEYKKGGEKT